MNSRLSISLAIGLAATILGSLFLRSDLFDRLEAATWAWRVQTFAPRHEPSSQVQTILVDQESLDWGKTEMAWSWPWPREVYAVLLSFCRRGGAKGVAFDILYTEPSTYGVEDDQTLGTAMRETPVFIGAGFEKNGKETWPIPEVRTNATRIANVSETPDPDGVFRRSTLFRKDPADWPSLGYALWRAANPAADPHPPLDLQNRLLLNFHGTNGQHRAWRAAAIIQAEMNLQNGEPAAVDPAVFSNAYVFVGYSAPGLMDLRPTPVNRVLPGVEIHATVVDNLLTGRFLRDLPSSVTILLYALFAFLIAFLTALTAKTALLALIFIIGALLPLACGFLLYPAGYNFPVAAGQLTVLATTIGCMILYYTQEGRQKAFIKKAFRHYLGESVINRMLEDPGLLQLGGEKRELTIFFSDIEKFSTFSERLSPERLTALLTDYLTLMGSVIQEEGGYLDKYIGDAIVAFWNAPVYQPDHAARACRAAIRCQQTIRNNAARWKAEYGVDLHARIGLNTGEVVVGNMGSRERFNYTILGDAANLASRLEGANKAFGTYVMVSESTFERAGSGFPARRLATLRVVGRSTPVEVFELATDPAGAPPFWKAFAVAAEAFRQGHWAEAGETFSRWPEDPPSRAYQRACERLSADPPAVWDGVWNLSEK
ncbi:MAG: adenylate/guanylate cyclase domain-containing protein [Kiritimatiellae bacterium]|nr:adenylate/guanylate cyclase domain-containing protein [Kiritimatiellia bacterium]